MTGWTAMAGTHTFTLPDEHSARACARDLADHGFPHVTGQPARDDGWTVLAHDLGPYPTDATGHRAIDAVGRTADTIARRHGGRLTGGTRCDPATLRSLPETTALITHTNHGSRAPAPVITMTEALPPATIATTPDTLDVGPVDFDDLHDVDWSTLDHAHGSADDIPYLLDSLAIGAGDWHELIDHLLGDNLLHQGTCYTATAPAMTFVAQLPATTPDRVTLYAWLVHAAALWPEAALDEEDPEPAGIIGDVHTTLGTQIPALLARWDDEPPATRYLLACLAALYPHHGHHLTPAITAMAAQHTGTSHGAYLTLAAALTEHRDDDAHDLARTITDWDDHQDPAVLDAPGPAAPVVLARGVLATAHPTT